MSKIAKKLSAPEVSRLEAPGLFAVGAVPGLHLQVSLTGAKSWILRIKIGNKRRDMGLGPYPAVTLAQAHQKAREARESVDQGVDPILTRERAQSERRAAQAGAVTFKDAAAGYIKAKSPEWGNAKHAQQWTNTILTYVLPVIGMMHVQDVTDAHILKILEPLWSVRTETATRVRGRIEKVLDWATVRKYRTGLNPARWRGHLETILPAPRKITPVKHHEAIPVDQAPAFYAALKQRPGMAARALEFLLLTAVRSENARGAAWSEFDLEKGLWTIPAGQMKAKREHRVHLSESAIGILNAQPHLVGCNLVFPTAKGGRLSDMALTAVMRRMRLSAVPHGLRSTFKDWAADETDYPNEMSEMALAHVVSDKVEAAYRRGDMLKKRRAMMEDWAAFLNTRQV